MQFDPDNKIVQLCARGIELEGADPSEVALKLYQQAWSEAENNLEKFIAAHYLARVQNSTEEKLDWDQLALSHALKVDEEQIKGAFPSLYLNIAKCYEDLNLKEKALESYFLALSFTNYLANDGYGKLIKSGIQGGIKRLEH